jgi:cell division protease FtsH
MNWRKCILKEFANDPHFKDVLKPTGENEITSGPNYQFTIGSVESFERKLDEAQKNYPENEKVYVSYEKKRIGYGILL